MILEILVGGLLFMGGTAVCRRANLPPVRSFLPSKTLRGSPEDLDPNEIAVNLAITRMLRNIDKITSVDNRTLYYSDEKIKLFKFGTYSYFNSSDFTRSKFCIHLQVGGEAIITEGKYPRIARQVLTVRNLYLARSKQQKKEADNAQAFAVIEALTDAKPAAG